MRKRLGSIVTWIRTCAFILTFVVMAGISSGILLGCEAKEPTVTEYFTKSGLQNRDKIRIGVLVDVPLLGMVTDGVYSGFDVEIGRYIAKSLGFQTEKDRDIEWVPTTLEDRERKIQEGTADLVIATYSITDDRKKRVRFAGPYLITSQELLIHPSMADKIHNLDDLVREQIEVCLPGATTSQTNLNGYNIKTARDVTSKMCLEGLVSGRYKVFTTDEVVLAGFNHTVDNRFQFVNVPFEFTEQYGIAMAKDNEYLQALVEHYLQKSFDNPGPDNPWRLAWAKTLGQTQWVSENGKNQPRPEISRRLRDVDDRNQAVGMAGIDRSSRTPVPVRRRRRTW